MCETNQFGFSEYIKKTLGTERQILSGDPSTFHFAMTIDEMEDILNAGDIFALFWILDSIKEESRSDFLEDIRDAYLEAIETYEKGGIENVDRHFRDGMHYTYCYTKKLPIDDDTRKKAVKFFVSDSTKYKLGMLIVAYAIGRYSEQREKGEE